MLFENLNLNAYYHNILLLLLQQVYQNKQRWYEEKACVSDL